MGSLFSDDRWLLPPARTENQLLLQVHLTTLSLSQEEDVYDWEVNGNNCKKFSTGDIYTYIQGPKPTVLWSPVVWCSYGIPRHSFLTWLVMLDRCPTKDRLLRWGINGIDPVCLLCNRYPESRDHLFFECSYSGQTWSSVADRCQLQALPVWNDNISQLQLIRGNKDLRKLTLIAFQATVYWLWNERNTRLHHQSFRSSTTLFHLIDRQIRNRLLSFRQTNGRASSSMMQLWFLRSEEESCTGENKEPLLHQHLQTGPQRHSSSTTGPTKFQ